MIRNPEITICRAVGGIAFSLAYGIHIKVEDDPNIKIADDALGSVLDALLPGKNMVDVMPFLKYVPEWVPGATRFQREARLGREIMTRMHEAPWNQALKEIVSRPIYCLVHLSTRGKSVGSRDCATFLDIHHSR